MYIDHFLQPRTTYFVWKHFYFQHVEESYGIRSVSTKTMKTVKVQHLYIVTKGLNFIKTLKIGNYWSSQIVLCSIVELAVFSKSG